MYNGSPLPWSSSSPVLPRGDHFFLISLSSFPYVFSPLMKMLDMTLSKSFMKSSFANVIRKEFFGGWVYHGYLKWKQENMEGYEKALRIKEKLEDQVSENPGIEITLDENIFIMMNLPKLFSILSLCY